MSQYYIEVQTPSSSGWHRSGSNLPGDPLHITGKAYALPMGIEFAKQRVDTYRSNQCKARIVHRDGAVVVDWDQPTVTAQSPIDLHNSHELVTYHNHGLEIVCVHNRAINKYFHKFRWPVADGPEQSISGLSPEEIVQKLLSIPDLAGYVATLRHEDIMPVATAPVAPPAPAVPAGVKVPGGYAIAGLRPGSVR